MAAFPRRQVVLFFVAVLFPSAMLAAFGLRIIGQERELAEKRLTDDRQRLVTMVRQSLLAELETIKSDALRPGAGTATIPRQRPYAHPAVDLIAPLVDGMPALPWEMDDRVARARGSLLQPNFARAVARGERAELAEGNLGRAIEAYRGAVRTAVDRVQVAHGRLLLARALTRAGHPREAADLYRALLDLSSEVVDEHGIPVALYAAEALLNAGGDDAHVLRRVRTEVESPAWHTPAVAYLLRDLLHALTKAPVGDHQAAATTVLAARVNDEITVIERGAVLRSEFAVLTLAGRGRTDTRLSPWAAFADGAWLIATVPVPGTASEALIAVNTSRLLAGAALPPATEPASRFAVRSNGNGEPLGPSVPGLTVQFAQPAEDVIARATASQRSLSLVVLLLVLSVTLVGGYLLWRDVQREARLAALRAHFVSSVSHELKTPLTAIRMFAETLRAQDRPRPRTQAEYLDTIIGESERLTRLLNNVLDHSKIEQDQKRYQRAPLALADIVRRAAGAMEYPMRQDGFKLQVEISGDVPPVSGDADAVEQAILNLLTNAMKYSGDSRAIALRLRLANGDAVIDVVDRGVGIPEHERAHIMEKFYRGRSSENERIPGTGLGLALVDHMARAHGGCLEVESAVGEGSTFSIHLPLEGGS